jgi:hypothetical protein
MLAEKRMNGVPTGADLFSGPKVDSGWGLAVDPIRRCLVPVTLLLV